jgi:hypothetical protein
MMNIEIAELYGGVVVKADEGDREHRWWFDETDEGRLVLAAEVIEDGGRRYYVDSGNLSVPEPIMGALDRDVYDMRGHKL